MLKARGDELLAAQGEARRHASLAELTRQEKELLVQAGPAPTHPPTHPLTAPTPPVLTLFSARPSVAATPSPAPSYPRV